MVEPPAHPRAGAGNATRLRPRYRRHARCDHV